MLSVTQRAMLRLIGMHWSDFYRVYEENGLCKAELLEDSSVLLVAQTPADLETLLKEDRASRPHTEARWIETSSGPPFKVRASRHRSGPLYIA